MIPNTGLSGAFYKMRNDDALFSKAASNLSGQLAYIQNLGSGAHAFLENNGQTVRENPQKEVEQFGKTYSWPDTEINAQYLSEAVDIESIEKNIEGKAAFKVLKAYISEGSEGALNVVPYVQENVVLEGGKDVLSSVNVGIKVCANSKDDFEEGLQKFKVWERSSMAANFRPIKFDGNKEFSLFS
ncbi:MAG: hypothetical protein COA45_10340 [Zetaproteobacteria bacterium]|nr:MAG: hypothetical protein COA45_10340 [Zetaproteobacteria bacterium]